ncbi:MAG: ACT domain-containing protein [Pseudomonadota bacterium]
MNKTTAPPTGITDLDALLAGMSPILHPALYVFVTLAPAAPPYTGPFQLRFQEAEGETLVIKQDDAEAAGFASIYPCRMITLRIASSLEAVGFLAVVTTHLAAAGIGVNPVSAYHHDHLFISPGDAQKAMEVLHALSRGTNAPN